MATVAVLLLGLATTWFAGVGRNDEIDALPADDGLNPLQLIPPPTIAVEAGEVEALVAVPQIPSSPPQDVPSALDDPHDSRFPPPLVDPDAIRSGGPPPDGIPPIDEPRFQPADTVGWLEPEEPVLVVEVDGEARAYPVQVMIWHELVNDSFGDRPVTVSYCPLCNSAIAYDRRLASRDLVLDFGTSGQLYHSALVMYDRQTESLWSHFTGEAVVGHLAGEALETLPVATVSWAEFREAHPDGLVLSRQTGFERDYGRNPYPGYDDVARAPFLFDGETDPRLPAQTRVVSVRGQQDSVAIVHDHLFAEQVVEVTVDGRELVALLSKGTASALDTGRVAGGRDVGATGVFVPVVDGQELTFDAVDETTFRDVETGTTWSVLGVGLDGPLAGEQLGAVEHLDTFWFAIAAFRPDTMIIGG